MSRILLLTPQLPYPAHQGTTLRNLHIIKGLAARHQVTLLSFAAEEAQEPEATPLGDLCRQVFTVPVPQSRSTATRLVQMVLQQDPDMALRLRSPHFELRLKRALVEDTYDIVQIEGIEMAWTVEIIRHVNMVQRIVYDAHNAEALLQHRAFQADAGNPKRWPAAAYSWVQHRRLRDFEGKILKTVDGVTAVSEADRQSLGTLFGGDDSSIAVIPNSIDVDAYGAVIETASGEQPSLDLVFAGKMDYRPNVDAVLWFAHEVWPRLRAAEKDLSWAIVGQKPHERLEQLSEQPGITITGWVKAVQPYLFGAKVVVMPFRVGSGTRLKLIEAFAAGKAVVSTTLGVEGYPVVDGRELLIADNADEMAAKITLLLRDEDLRSGLGEEARRFARSYDWRRVVPAFDDVYNRLLV